MMIMKHFLIQVARKTIENFVKTGEKNSVPTNYPEEYKKKGGVFVTIYKKKPKRLRGCIGFPYPQLTIIEGVIEASVHASQDPRFEPLSKEDLDDINIEISILTEPELIQINDPKKYLEKIDIGKDGLILKNDFNSGLLLPQVPVEQNWSVEEFLENLCLKAGLTIDAWMDSKCKIYKFQTKIIHENSAL